MSPCPSTLLAANRQQLAVRAACPSAADAHRPSAIAVDNNTRNAIQQLFVLGRAFDKHSVAGGDGFARNPRFTQAFVEHRALGSFAAQNHAHTRECDWAITHIGDVELHQFLRSRHPVAKCMTSQQMRLDGKANADVTAPMAPSEQTSADRQRGCQNSEQETHPFAPDGHVALSPRCALIRASRVNQFAHGPTSTGPTHRLRTVGGYDVSPRRSPCKPRAARGSMTPCYSPPGGQHG